MRLESTRARLQLTFAVLVGLGLVIVSAVILVLDPGVEARPFAVATTTATPVPAPTPLTPSGNAAPADAVVRSIILSNPPEVLPGQSDADGPPREDIASAMEYASVPIGWFRQEFGVDYEAAGARHDLKRGTHTVTYHEGEPAMVVNGRGESPVLLPFTPRRVGGQLVVPIKIFAEALGLNTQFARGSNQIAVFELSDRERYVRAELDEEISGSDAVFSYFVKAYRAPGRLLLLSDNSNEIIQFDETGERVTARMGAPREFGLLRSFVVLPANRQLIAFTSLGIVLSWDEGAKSFRTIGGAGRTDLTTLRRPVPLAQYRGYNFMRAVINDRGIVYVATSTGDVFEIDFARSEIALVAAGVNALVHVAVNGSALLLNSNNADAIVLQLDPATGRIERPACPASLLRGRRIYGLKYLPAADRWLVLDASAREIIEARLQLRPGETGCEILRVTSVQGDTAFLNGFGELAPDLPDLGSRAVVIDSDGLNLIDYRAGGEYRLIRKETLGRSLNLRFIAPVAVIEHERLGPKLYIASNLSHRVFEYDLARKTLIPYLGTGLPTRSEAPVSNSVDTGIGYISLVDLVEGRLTVGDQLNRRLVEDDGHGIAKTVVGGAPSKEMSGVSGFCWQDGRYYITDAGYSLVFSAAAGQRTPDLFAGFDQRRGSEDVDQEAVARSRAQYSLTPPERPFPGLIFGRPDSIVCDGRSALYVADLYRHGVWRLDLATGRGRPVAGMLSRATYQVGGMVGNAGLAGADVRLSSPSQLVFDRERRLLIVPSHYSGAVVIMREDLGRSVEVQFDRLPVWVNQARILRDGRLAVADSAQSKVLIYRLAPLDVLTSDPPRLVPR